MAFSKPASKKEPVLPNVQEGEPVLTFHGPVLREAECVRVVMEDRQVKYLVRYKSQGAWMGALGAGASPLLGLHASSACESSLGAPSCSGPSTSSATPSTSYATPGPSGSSGPSAGSSFGPIACWDYEWIPESRVLRFCATGKDSDGDDSSTTSSGACGQASDLGEGSSHGDGEGEGDGECEGAGEGAAAGSEDVVQPPHKRRNLGAPARTFLKRREVKVTLPDALKPLLVKDWELVIHGKKLFNLPARKPVDAILAEYEAFQQNSGVLTKQFGAHELVAGIREYFNVMLGTQLLYKFERPQYREILANYPCVRMSQIYGGAHLLRLFVQIGSMLAYTALDDSSLNLLLSHLQDFLKYLASKPSVLFTPADYQVASAEYQQGAE